MIKLMYIHNYIHYYMLNQQLSQEQLDALYEWVDGLPLSRPKKNIHRDFSDGLMMAETIHHYFPKLVDLHNYPGTNSIKSKIQNWKILNNKVLSKLGLSLTIDECQRLASSSPMLIEVLLYEFKRISDEEEVNDERARMAVQKMQDRNSFGKENERGSIGITISKADELRQILGLLKEKIGSVERTIQRKDAQIKELEEIIQMGS